MRTEASILASSGLRGHGRRVHHAHSSARSVGIQSQAMARPTILVVSYFAHHPWGPRGLRTRAILDALARDWHVTLVAGPQGDFARATHPAGRATDFARYKLHEAVGIDLHESWSKRLVRHWPNRPDVVLVIGYPFSPAVEAAGTFGAEGVPIVVDMSDPWVLTAAHPAMGRIGLWRARRAERRLWTVAAGAILTTHRQERALSSLFPHLRTLVRPNGYQRVENEQAATTLRAQGGELRIGHFGNLYYPRVALAPFLALLAESGLWESITFEQFGNDWNRTLDAVPARVRVRAHAPAPWDRVLELSRELDVALVVGNVDPAQMPSKVVEYLTLPIPRLALVTPPGDDAITDYIADKPGWLAVRADDPDAARAVHAHLERRWTTRDLAPPPGESWPEVGREIMDFLPRFLAPELRTAGLREEAVTQTADAV
jgi:hypothetical protein